MVNPNAPSRSVRFAAAACHLAGLAGYVYLIPWAVPWGAPGGPVQLAAVVLGFFLIPLVLILVSWRSLRHLHPIIDASGRAALNFWLTLTLFQIITAVVLSFLTVAICGNSGLYDANTVQVYWGMGIFFGVPMLAGVVGLVQMITIAIATAKALLHGTVSRYRPWSRQFFRGESSDEA